MKNSPERTAWILMERIVPPVQLSYTIRSGVENKADELEEVVSELGIFGVLLGYESSFFLIRLKLKSNFFLKLYYRDGNKIFLNEQVGHMLRTKLSSANEGGLLHGDGCCDSPFLMD